MKESLETPSQRLFYLIRNTRLSPTELSEKLPISLSTASRWKNGKVTYLDATKREEVASLMGYNLQWIESGEGDPLSSSKKEEGVSLEALLREERSRYGIEDIPDTERGRALQDVLDEAVSVVLRLRRLIEIERRTGGDRQK